VKGNGGCFEGPEKCGKKHPKGVRGEKKRKLENELQGALDRKTGVGKKKKTGGAQPVYCLGKKRPARGYQTKKKK